MDKRTLLTLLGVVFLIFSGGLWYSERDAGSSTITERFTRGTVKQTSDPAETTQDVQTSGVASPGTTTSSSSRTTTGASATQTITKPSTKTVTTRAKPTRSDSLILGLLGLGGAFVLAGAFYDRISGFKFLGTEVTLGAAKALEETVAELEASQKKMEQAVRSLAKRLETRKSR